MAVAAEYLYYILGRCAFTINPEVSVSKHLKWHMAHVWYKAYQNILAKGWLALKCHVVLCTSSLMQRTSR